MSGDESTPISENGCEVYVRGLPADVTEDDLNSAFAGYGTLEKVRVKSRPKGSFAFLLFSDGAGASAAIDAMNDQPFKYVLSPPVVSILNALNTLVWPVCLVYIIFFTMSIFGFTCRSLLLRQWGRSFGGCPCT